MKNDLRSAMAPIYAAVLPAIFDAPYVEETRATCDDCAMCDKGPAGGGRGAGSAYFEPGVKCCTYQPTLPNYLVGALLDDPSPELAEGQRRARDRIRARIGVTPGWLAPPRKFYVLHEAARAAAFGRSRALLCPYLDAETTRCTIWRHRESICSTFFCKHVAGATGNAFWEALAQYLAHVERSLSRAAARHVHPDAKEPSTLRGKLSLEDLEDRPPTDEDYASYWGPWVGREPEFYSLTYQYVQSLTRESASEILDNDVGRAALDKLVAAHRALTEPRLARSLVRNPRMQSQPSATGQVVTTYSRFDPLELTQALYDALGLLRAEETVPENLERLRREHGLALGEDMLLALQLHGVVVEPSEP
ncbi:MAG: hypothetical protein U0271_04865 [Polyangiaceae bacterium]